MASLPSPVSSTPACHPQQGAAPSVRRVCHEVPRTAVRSLACTTSASMYTSDLMDRIESIST
eukprot:8924812-Heterocapsa_arctica.AAC.1